MRKVIKLNVGTGWANGDHNDEMELPVEWDDWSQDKQDKFVSECAQDFLNNCCECSGWVEEVED